MTKPATKTRSHARRFSKTATSKDGYTFDIDDRYWKLNKDVTVSLGLAADLPEPTQGGFRATLQRYAEEMSASHTYNMAEHFKRFLHSTASTDVTSAALLDWRAILGESEQWYLGGMKGFLLAWHDYGFQGITGDVVNLLQEWRIKGNEKGAAVVSGCPESGPYTDLEIAAILDWANKAVTQHVIPFWIYAYLLTLALTARRTVQIAALRGKDLLEGTRGGARQFRVNFPRVKQRGGGFRQAFRSLAVIEELYLVLQQKHRQSVTTVEAALGEPLAEDLRGEVPIFINERSLSGVTTKTAVHASLTGARPDCLHERTHAFGSALRRCGRLSTARSERTGEIIRLFASRFRYTRGTKLRREGFGAFVIAELLDHSDTQNVRVYTENTAQEALVIDELIGSRLAPFAQACMGKLVRSEREAIRGDDPTSRIPNHHQKAVGTCGNYGFCASGFRACYTCHHFQPWMNGPHEEVLAELYTEKERTQAAGCAQEVVNANDQLILAVEHCVSLCQEAKAEDSQMQQDEDACDE